MSARSGSTWLGIDVGTSSVKALVIADDGRVLGRAASSYPTSRPGRGMAEQDPWDYVTAAIAALAECGVDALDIAAVGLVGQTPSLVTVDAESNPVRPAITWQDQRAGAEADRLAQTLGDPLAVVGTSLPWSANSLAAVLLWLATHEAENLRRIRWLLQPKDFVGLVLTGDPNSDPWSSKGLVTVLDPAPCLPVLELAGVSAEIVPPLRPAWARRGAVSREAASRFGLRAGIPVSVGWSDALAGMLAIGAFQHLGAFVLTGTSDIVGVTCESGPADATPLYRVPRSCAPSEIVYGPTSTSGASVAWLADLLDSPVADLLDLAAEDAGDPDDLPIFVPYLDGERAPIWRTDVAASLTGLRSRHGRADLVRSVLNGVVAGERHILQVADRLVGSGAESTVRTGGVGSAHPAWLTARRSILGRSVSAHDEPALTALGSAMLARAAAADGDLAAAEALRSAAAADADAEAVSADPTDAIEHAAATRRFERYQAASDFAVRSVS